MSVAPAESACSRRAPRARRRPAEDDGGDRSSICAEYASVSCDIRIGAHHVEHRLRDGSELERVLVDEQAPPRCRPWARIRMRSCSSGLERGCGGHGRGRGPPRDLRIAAGGDAADIVARCVDAWCGPGVIVDCETSERRGDAAPTSTVTSPRRGERALPPFPPTRPSRRQSAHLPVPRAVQWRRGTSPGPGRRAVHWTTSISDQVTGSYLSPPLSTTA